MSLQALLKSKGVASTQPTAAVGSTDVQQFFQFQPELTAVVMPPSLHNHRYKESPSRPVLITSVGKALAPQIHTVKMSAGHAYTIAYPLLKKPSSVSHHAAPIFYGFDRLSLRSEAEAPPAYQQVHSTTLPCVKANTSNDRLYFNPMPITSFTSAPLQHEGAEAEAEAQAIKAFAAQTSFLFKSEKLCKLLSTEAARRLQAPTGPVERVSGGTQSKLVPSPVSTQLSKPLSRVAVLINADKMTTATAEAPLVGVRFRDSSSSTMRTALTLTHKGATVEVSMWATDFHAAYGESDHRVHSVQLEATPAIFYLKGAEGRTGFQWEVEQVTPLHAHRLDVQASTVLQSDVLCARILEGVKNEGPAEEAKNKEGKASELAQRIEFVRSVGALPLQMLADGFVQDYMAVGLCTELLKSAGMVVDSALTEALTEYDVKCTNASPSIPEEPQLITDFFKALFESEDRRNLCVLATFAVPAPGKTEGAEDDSDDELGDVLSDNDSAGDAEEESEDDEFGKPLSGDEGDGDSATADTCGKRGGSNHVVVVEEEDEPAPKRSRGKGKG